MRLVLAFLLLSACTPLTDAERSDMEYRRAVDLQNWKACRDVYAAALVSTYCTDHIHPHPLRWTDGVRSDLRWWKCQRYLGDRWINY